MNRTPYSPFSTQPARRHALTALAQASVAASAASLSLPVWAQSNTTANTTNVTGKPYFLPLEKLSGQMAQAVRAFTNNAPLKPGRVQLDVAPLVENGNTVPIVVSADSPMTATDFVQKMALFNEKNPFAGMAVYTLSARSGKAQAEGRFRLATSQALIAVAQMSDGSFHSVMMDVLVTLAACIED